MPKSEYMFKCVVVGDTVGKVGSATGASVGEVVGEQTELCELRLPVNMSVEVTPVRSQQTTWLNASAYMNVRDMSVTEVVFHAPIGSLNVSLLWKSIDMSVMRPVSQPAMFPYVDAAALGSLHHAFTVRRKLRHKPFYF